jgi:hypothetical protein
MQCRTALAALVIAAFAGAAQAQSRPKPDDSAAPAASPSHTSAFEGYRAFADEPLAPWREVNDAVGRVGGHVGILRDEERAQRAREGARPQAPDDRAGGAEHKRH